LRGGLIVTKTRAAICAARAAVRVAVAAEQTDNPGVSDPHFAAPFFAQGAAPRGSLTPHLRVAVVRSNRALVVVIG